MALGRLALFASLLAALGYGQKCYFPNGTASPEPYQICDPTAEFSSCCGPDDECLTNGLCRPTNSRPTENDYWRDGCTDPTWKASECGKYCYNSTTGTGASSINYFVNSCNADTYCCANLAEWDQGVGYTCCNQANLLFKAGPPKWLSGPQLAISYVPISSSTASSQTTSQTSSSSTQPRTVTSTSSSATGGTTGTNSQGNSSSNSGLTSGESAAVGAVVGVAGLAAIIAGVYFYRKRQERQRVNQTTEGSEGWADVPSNGPANVYAYYDPPITSNNSNLQQPGMMQRQELDGQRFEELPADGDNTRKGPAVRPAEMP